MCDKHSALYPALQLTVVFCLYCRLTTRFLTMALGCVSFPLNMEDKTLSSGMAGLESVSLEAPLLLRFKQHWQQKKGTT